MRLTVNGVDHDVKSPPLASLLYELREELHVTSPKAGCEQGGCAREGAFEDDVLELGGRRAEAVDAVVAGDSVEIDRDRAVLHRRAHRYGLPPKRIT